MKAVPAAFPPSGATDTGAASRRTGQLLSAMVVLFLLFDGGIKVIGLDVVRETSVQLGLNPAHSMGLGVMTLIIALLYALPRTAVLGAVLLTGLLGGAIATQLRVSNPVFTHLLFGVYVGVMAWGGLYLRDTRLRTLLPVRR